MKPKIVIALDTDLSLAKKIVHQALKYNLNIFKIGHLLFDTKPEIINYITTNGGKILLDLKFHDIPSVIAKAIKSILNKYSIFGLTIHTLGGKQMLTEVKKTIDSFEKKYRPLIFGVTVLTSLDNKDAKVLGFNKKTNEIVLTLAKFAQRCGIDGIVCSPKEVKKVKSICGKNFLTLVPGVNVENKIEKPEDRNQRADKMFTDQKRTANLLQVIKTGADYIVIGRSVYETKNLDSVFETIKTTLN